VTGEGSDWMLLVKHIVWLRTPLSHVRRMLQRGQSFHSTTAGGSDAGVLVRVGEQSEGEEESGHTTTLTRRGLIVARLS
jgi:hypothetical protein